MSPFVSVIIPTFNRKERLEQAVRSAGGQTFQDFELIVVDDGSDDGTAEWASGNAEALRFRYVRCQLNRGVSTARNTGVAHAAGEWIAFLDSDDTWEPQKLERQAAWIGRNPSYRIVQTRERWIRRGKHVNPPKTHEKKCGDIFSESLARCMITPSSVMIQKRLFEKTGGFNESLPACEDYDLWLRISCRYPVGLVDEELCTRYGGHEDQLSSTVFALDRFRVRALLDLIANAPLTVTQEWEARRMLARKAAILAHGYEKHGKADCHERYAAIAARAADRSR